MQIATARCPVHRGPEEIYDNTGLGTAQEGMNALYGQLSALARSIRRAHEQRGRTATETLAAMWEYMPATGSHSGFDFEHRPATYEMLFRACLLLTGLSKFAMEIKAPAANRCGLK